MQQLPHARKSRHSGSGCYDLIEATKAYKSGARNHAQMKALVAGLSDADIQDIEAYYAAQIPCK